MDSNLVAFYYGNLTHPSVDPPRIGFLSMVPDDANVILQTDITQAKANGGNFESMSESLPHPDIMDLMNLFCRHRHVANRTNERIKHYLGDTYRRPQPNIWGFFPSFVCDIGQIGNQHWSFEFVEELNHCGSSLRNPYSGSIWSTIYSFLVGSYI